jgi:hypothetical protein
MAQRAPIVFLVAVYGTREICQYVEANGLALATEILHRLASHASAAIQEKDYVPSKRLQLCGECNVSLRVW